MNNLSDINEITLLIGQWADKTFPQSTEATILSHLKDEVNRELIESCNNDEIADAIMILMHLAHKRKIDLKAEIIDKFNINLKRTWNSELNIQGFLFTY